MITFKIEEREINMSESWKEITLNQYISILNLEKIIGTFLFNEIYYIRLLEVLCNEEENGLDDMTLETLNSLIIKTSYILEIPEWPINNHILFNDKIWVFPTNYNKLTMGEVISIKTLQQKPDLTQTIPDLLSVILRPGKKVLIDGVEKYIADKFDGNLDERREEILKMTVYNLIGPVNFFLNGSNS